MLHRPFTAAALILFALGACRTAPAREARATSPEADLAAAHAAFDREPDSLDAAIWVGRRMAYLGRFEDAIDWYTKSLARHPASHELLRHRGHRYLSVRDFEAAEADLARAAGLIRGVPDEVEPDGQPNAAGIPRSTSHSNIHYHLGLAHYLQGEFEEARASFERCLEFAANDDMLVATAHWYVMSLRRLGRADEAEAYAKATYSPDMEILENDGYHALLALYAGAAGPESVLDEEASEVQFATRAYGLANWRLTDGDRAAAYALMERIALRSDAPAFGRLAAEADLARRAKRVIPGRSGRRARTL